MAWTITFIITVLFFWVLYRLNKRNKTITGYAYTIDGDSLVINDTEIRLYGIDAPEHGQPLLRKGDHWPGAAVSTRKLRNLIGNQQVRCIVKDTDKYGRKVCECFVGDTNINAWMVENGWAVAYRRYSRRYVRLEEKARKRKNGIWRYKFVSPETWRRHNK